MSLLCPLCAAPLTDAGHFLKCPSGHCFDRAKSGYVNLLLPGKGVHGDDKRMVRARRAFLDSGYYRPLIEEAARFCGEAVPAGGLLLDCGCGEGSYTLAIAQALLPRGADIIGLDISKDAVDLAARRVKGAMFAVASVFHLPIETGSVDGILNLFAPMVPAEYARVLKKGGWVLKATPLPKHLYELKEAVYEQAYLTEPEPEEWEGFLPEKKWQVEFPMHLPDNGVIRALFEMTPYCYTTPAAGLERLSALTALDVTAAIQFALYRRG